MSNLYMENWDLQTLVVGENMENPSSSSYSFDPWSFQLEEDDILSFPEIFEPNNPKVVDDQYLVNPYSIPPVLEDHHHHHVAEPEKQKQQQSVLPAKPKRSSRKNQQNRVVRHVTADDLQSDIWAWRKYGQKPIKGSPYPRSYYRCSSLKGCLARKKVERSCSDPETFIITYTAEHSHGQPNRRNSLAGTTRNKVSKRLYDKNQVRLHGHVSIRDHESNSVVKVKEESIKMEELHMIEDVDKKDKVLCDELVQSFEGFEGLFLDQFSDLSHELWLP